eukprot:Ihof_evm2s625 gene=Ihof_evmTU2s625
MAYVSEGSKTAAFKLAFKKYKRHTPPPPMDEVIDVKHLESLPSGLRERVRQVKATGSPDIKTSSELLSTPPSEWKIYKIDGIKGLLYIPNAFKVKEQRAVIRRALEDYIGQPNKSNL